MLAIRLPDEIENRLDNLARRTGRTKTFYAREAILMHLEDLEDYYLVANTVARVRKGQDTVHSSEEVRKSLKGDLGEFWRYRIGDYRVLCEIIDEELIILVATIGHRREVYE